MTEDQEKDKHDLEHEYIALCMKREARKEAFYNAVIDKTVGGLVLAGILSLCGVIGVWLSTHLNIWH